MTRTTRIWKGAVAVAIAGCTASRLMNRFQAAVTKLKDRDRQEQNSQDREDATMKAADALAKNVNEVGRPCKKMSLQGRGLNPCEG